MLVVLSFWFNYHDRHLPEGPSLLPAEYDAILEAK